MKHWHLNIKNQRLESHSHVDGHLWHEHRSEGLVGYGKTKKSFRRTRR